MDKKRKNKNTFAYHQDLFKDFHERGRFGKDLNSTFLVLIPKIKGAEDLKDFRPISLIGRIYNFRPRCHARSSWHFKTRS